MGASASALIDELHTSAQLSDDFAADRKLHALRQVQELGKDPDIALQIVENGGMLPLLGCYNSAHPLVRLEAAKALAVLARQPSNQLEMGQDDILPQYHPSLLSASLEFREHAIALLAQLASQPVNRLKIAHEGLLTPIIDSVAAPNEALQLHALDALAKLCEVQRIAELVCSRGAMARLLKVARSPKAIMKVSALRVMTSLAACASNLQEIIKSGSLVFLIGCVYCSPEVQLEVVRCLRNLMWQIFEGTMGIADKLAQMLFVMSSIEVSQERIVDDEEKLQLDLSDELRIAELIPDLAERAKKLVNCDRASIFVLRRDENVLCTILFDSTEIITIPADLHSMAGECAVHGRKINQHDAYKHPSFNPAIDKKTGYRTHAMLLMPIRRSNSESAPIIGVVQCINKLSGGEGAVYGEEGAPVFTAEDENNLSQFCLLIAAPLEKAWQNKKPPRAKNELGNDWVENIRVLTQLDLYTVMRVILDRMRTLTDADRASLFVHDQKRKELWTKIAEDAPAIRLKSNTGIVGAVATEGEPLNILDAYKDPRFNRKIDVATGYRTKSILCLPIKNQRGQVIGVVQCINKKSGPAFTPEDMQILDEFSWQVPAPRLTHDAHARSPPAPPPMLPSPRSPPLPPLPSSVPLPPALSPPPLPPPCSPPPCPPPPRPHRRPSSSSTVLVATCVSDRHDARVQDSDARG